MLPTKENAAKLSVASVTLLITIKIVASILTGSISIRADAVHSALDLVAAITTFIGVRISGRPADRQHPFGHGKAENISSTIVAGLILTAAGIIIYFVIGAFQTAITFYFLRINISISIAIIRPGNDIIAGVINASH